jgi:predicted unusual protein kinase regulating ubiquinone biosynthesis (AarF/ABC1/UbiB family)
VLSRLQDRSAAAAQALAVRRARARRSAAATFAALDPAPIASASLAQVHRGRLHDGRDVAVKIQYPDIEHIVRVDLRSFALLVRVLARLEPNFDFRVVIDEVQKYVPLELDFVHEADNAERMAGHLRGRADILVPAVVRELSTRRVLVMEYAPGVRVTDVAGMRALGVDPADVARRLIDLFCEQILVHGFFHADPHPGNILVQRDGRSSSSTSASRRTSAGVPRGRRAAHGGHRRRRSDRDRCGVPGPRVPDAAESDESLALLGELFLGWALRNGRSFADPEMLAQFGAEMPKVMRENPLVQVPGDVLLVGRVMGLLSGIGKQLGTDVDLGATLLPYLSASGAPGASPRSA